MSNRLPIDPELMEYVNGGALGYDPEPGGTYTMRCQFSGAVFTGVTLNQIIEIAKFSATIPNTPEGEQQILDFARSKNYIK